VYFRHCSDEEKDGFFLGPRLRWDCDKGIGTTPREPGKSI